MKRKYSVYMHQNLVNGKVYIGMTSQSPNRRYGKDGVGYKQQPAIWEDICKYGWENFSHCICETGLSATEARKMERRLVRQHKANDPEFGYNRTPGGDKRPSGYKCSKPGIYKDCFGEKHPLSRPVYCPELDETFGSAGQAAIYAGVSPGAISLCARGETKTSGTHPHTGERLHWVYIDKNETKESML